MRGKALEHINIWRQRTQPWVYIPPADERVANACGRRQITLPMGFMSCFKLMREAHARDTHISQVFEAGMKSGTGRGAAGDILSQYKPDQSEKTKKLRQSSRRVDTVGTFPFSRKDHHKKPPITPLGCAVRVPQSHARVAHPS